MDYSSYDLFIENAKVLDDFIKSLFDISKQRITSVERVLIGKRLKMLKGLSK